MSENNQNLKELLIYITQIEDKRQTSKIKHKLSDIVMITLFAMLANVEYWEEIEEFGKLYLKALKRYLELPNRVPSHDAIQRVMATIEPEVTEVLLTKWMELKISGEYKKIRKILNIDGKFLNGMKNKNNSPLDIVSAYSKEDGICYSQVALEGKGNDIEAILRLLDKISVKECIVTIDAIGTQKEIIKKLGKKKGYFCLQVKGNQKTLKEDIEDYFADKGFRKKLKEEGMEGSKRDRCIILTTEENGKKQEQKRYYITNTAGGVEEFVRAVRGHWAIESYHWILDMTFREDANKTLNKNAARNLNILRKLAISILEELPFRKKFSRRIKRYIISLDVRRYLKLFFDI
ncbi:ISAs1 family transposase [Leptotrichia sp. HSP-342]|uniref:ISAs1 family transposase n=2 Tax=Leptotrichia mesophila TaxID=3239303 RepID=A0AB39V891_9FUSO